MERKTFKETLVNKWNSDKTLVTEEITTYPKGQFGPIVKLFYVQQFVSGFKTSKRTRYSIKNYIEVCRDYYPI